MFSNWWQLDSTLRFIMFRGLIFLESEWTPTNKETKAFIKSYAYYA